MCTQTTTAPAWNSPDYKNGYNTPAIRDRMFSALLAYRAEIKAGAILNVSISSGNSKTHVPSVSISPIFTCPARCKGVCDGKCYAVKGCAIHTSELNAYARNLAIYLEQPARYWQAIRTAAANVRFFRWHVAGDIVDAAYFSGMIETARALPDTAFLAFTKKYEIVNTWIDRNGAIPCNFKIVFSGWGDALKPINPHNLPETTVFPKHSEPRPEWLLCGGNCLECACRGVGCWQLQPGDVLAFELH